MNHLFFAITTAKLISVLGMFMMPIQIGALMDGLQLGEADAGFLGTLEFGALALGLVFMAANPFKTSARNYALIGVCLIVVCQVLSALVTYYSVLIVLRILVGFGAGLANAAATVTIAASYKEPERIAGYAFGFVYVMAVLLFIGAPYAIEYGNHRGLFLAEAVLVLLVCPLLFALPGKTIEKKKRLPVNLTSLLPLPVILLFIAEVFLMLGIGSVWAFSERLGLAINISPEDIGIYFALTMLAAIGGSIFIGWLGTRLGRTIPFVTCAIFASISCYIIAYPGGYIFIYVLGMLSVSAFQAIIIPFLIGISAAMDNSGRLAAAVVGIELFSFGSGAAVGGVIAETFGLQSVGWIAIAGGVVSAPLLALICLPIDRENNEQALHEASM